MDIIKKFFLFSSVLGAGTVIGMGIGIRLEERFVVTPLNAWNTVLIDKLTKVEKDDFKIVDDENEGEKE